MKKTLLSKVIALLLVTVTIYIATHGAKAYLHLVFHSIHRKQKDENKDELNLQQYNTV